METMCIGMFFKKAKASKITVMDQEYLMFTAQLCPQFKDTLSDAQAAMHYILHWDFDCYSVTIKQKNKALNLKE